MWKRIAADSGPRAREIARARLRSAARAPGVAICAAALFALACASAPPPPAIVTLSNDLHFSPTPIEVQVGQTVEWHNDSLLVHTVTLNVARAAKPEDVALPDAAEPFDSGVLLPHKVFRHRFEVTGRYRYYCVPHEATGMVGEVIVRP